MKILFHLMSLLTHAVAAVAIAVAGVWYGVVTYGLSTPQVIYNIIAAGLPLPILLSSFLLVFIVCVLIAKHFFQQSKQPVLKLCPVRRAGFWLLYLAGAASVFLAGVLLTTLNPMLDLPKPVVSWVIGGTPVELISLLLCLASACLIGLTNTQLSKH